MVPSSRFIVDDESLHILWDDGERVLYRAARPWALGEKRAVLVMAPAGERPSPAILDRLARHYELKNELESAWAARPIELVREHGRTMLSLEDPGGESLASLISEANNCLTVGQLLAVAARADRLGNGAPTYWNRSKSARK